MTQVDIPTRSVEARSAISVLFQEVNEIDIYTEDTAKGYEKLFTKPCYAKAILQVQYQALCNRLW